MGSSPVADLNQVANFPTRIPGCDSHSSALLDLFISSDASISTTMAFPPLESSGCCNKCFVKLKRGCPVSSHRL